MDDERTKKRSSPKVRHSDLKEKLRQSCLNRVREDRSRLLWKFRSSGETLLNQKEIVGSTFSDIVSNELSKIRKSYLDDSCEISTCDTEDTLMEYNGVPIDSEPSESEYLELLMEMDRILHEDLNKMAERETTSLEDYENYCEQEDNYLAQALFESLQLNKDQDKNDRVWCPICTKAYLQENRFTIQCPSCKLRLDIQSDQINLGSLRIRLEDVLDEHVEKGCKQRAKFCMESKFSLTALYVQCEACDTFEIVL